MCFIWWIFYIIPCIGFALVNTEKEQLPNIVLIVSDDQDTYLDGMKPMKNTLNLIGHQGAIFDNAFTTSPLCCPSRASILSGMYSHNHRTINNSYEGGCNGNYWRNNIELQALPVLLQQKGYETFFAGKYLNQYYGAAIPPGWKLFYGLHGNSRYYNYTLRENSENRTYENVYLTDLLLKQALEYIDDKVKNIKPFFMMITPPAPHQPFTSAERHKNEFVNVKAMKTPNFNRVMKDKHWLLAESNVLTNKTLHLIDIYFRNRWQSLLAVDELVAAIVKRLDIFNVLNKTYIIYTSDNGYHLGQFAQPYDKRQPYETDIRVPLLIRGPNIASNVSIIAPVALIDLAPTILEWANVTIPNHMDGQPINITKLNTSTNKYYHRCLLIEHHGEGNLDTYNADCPYRPDDMLYGCTIDGSCHCQDACNNTYACIRHFAKSINRLYCQFNDIEHYIEAYDILSDPFQMHNIVNELLPIEKALYALTIANLTHCSGTTSCSNVII